MLTRTDLVVGCCYCCLPLLSRWYAVIILWVTTVLLLIVVEECQGFSQSSPQQQQQFFSIRELTTTKQDIYDLADLRYDEWVAGHYEDTCSRQAFRQATLDLVRTERTTAVLVGARRCDDNKGVSGDNDGSYSNDDDDADGMLIGAAEMSHLELLQGHALVGPPYDDVWYITDVVTACDYRRMGIAQRLMEFLEQTAARCCSNHQVSSDLLLHVAPDNDAAMRFYTKLGYCNCQSTTTDDELLLPPDLDRRLDPIRLAENAGTQGQILFHKRLQLLPKKRTTMISPTSAAAAKIKKSRRRRRQRAQGGSGFQKQN